MSKYNSAFRDKIALFGLFQTRVWFTLTMIWTQCLEDHIKTSECWASVRSVSWASAWWWRELWADTARSCGDWREDILHPAEIVDSHHPSMLIFSSRISNMEKDANNCEIRVNKHHKNSRLKFNTTLKFSFLELKLGCFRINIFFDSVLLCTEAKKYWLTSEV